MPLRFVVPIGAAVLLLGGALALGAGHRDGGLPTARTGLMRAEIKSIAVGDGAPPVGVIVLAPAGLPLVVPFFVTPGEAGIVGERREGTGKGLPQAALLALGGKLEDVVLDGAEDPTAKAAATPHGQQSVEASVAEALEWAQATGAPILLTPGLVHARGIEPGQLERLAPGLAGSHREARPAETEGPTL